MIESKLVGGPISTDKFMKGLVKAGKMMKKVSEHTPSVNKLNEYVERQETSFEQPIEEQHLDVNKIKNSKLAEPIKQAMMNSMTSQPRLNESLKINFNKVKQELQETKPTTSKSVINDDNLMTLIENMIRKVLDEKLSQILSAVNQTTINENLVIKVGNSTFKGKITSISSNKE